MGHRLSKTAANSIAAKTTTSTNEQFLNTTTTATNIIPIPNSNKQQLLGTTINLQIQDSPTNNSNHITTTAGILQQQQHQYNTNNSISSSLTSVNNLSCGRQIIIKIQLAKMENGNETTTPAAVTPTSSSSFSQQLRQDTSLTESPSDCNLNSTELATTITAAGTQFLNLTLNSSNSTNKINCNSMPNSNTTIATTTAITTNTISTPTSAALFRTAGSSLNTKNNNYLHSNNGATSVSSINNSIISMSRMNERPERFNSLQFNDEIVEQNIGEIVEYCEVLEDHLQQPPTNNSSYNNTQMHSITEDPDNEVNVCCRRKSKSLAANGGNSTMSSNNNTGAKTKSRCRKCSCRDAFKRFLDPSHSRSSNKSNKQQKEQKRSKSQDRHSINNPILNNTNQHQHQHHHLQPQRSSMHSTNMSTSTRSPSLATTTSAIVVPSGVSNQVPLWSSRSAASGSDVIIPITTPSPSQFVVVQCAILNPSNAALHSIPNTNPTSNPSLNTNNNLLTITTAQDLSPSISTSSSANDLMVKVPSNNTRSTESACSPTGPIVHSQVDFVHYLVPDLERITNSSFYWGKMDRYEAERLLEGKPEGTFLLRDSAQEEFLFSVTFRKYGRSLHARIEQSDHRFSFDCHDPCVFTASTVTGLLEHYKDPACVMFFEPMLTIPLHRKNCFSLQKLCRATIVSTTSYDGINELELPARLKSYLKEYHYKQKLRVKSNEPQYTLHCK